MSRGLTNQEARDWCEQHGIVLAPHGPDLRPDMNRWGRVTSFSIPDVPAERIDLPKFLYPSEWDIPGRVLIWTFDWGVWPSCEHQPLFTRFRQALGEPRPLSESNAQLFEASETEDGQSYAILHCMFLWDCWLISESGTYIVEFSHDEWGELAGAPEAVERTRAYLLDRTYAKPEDQP
jgi:hypothetical protein